MDVFGWKECDYEENGNNRKSLCICVQMIGSKMLMMLAVVTEIYFPRRANNFHIFNLTIPSDYTHI